jgi:hypothetical protein
MYSSTADMQIGLNILVCLLNKNFFFLSNDSCCEIANLVVLAFFIVYRYNLVTNSISNFILMCCSGVVQWGARTLHQGIHARPVGTGPTSGPESQVPGRFRQVAVA